jgi:hypothetical protein
MRKRASRIDRVANRLDALPRGLSDFVGAFLQTGCLCIHTIPNSQGHTKGISSGIRLICKLYFHYLL